MHCYCVINGKLTRDSFARLWLLLAPRSGYGSEIAKVNDHKLE